MDHPSTIRKACATCTHAWEKNAQHVPNHACEKNVHEKSMRNKNVHPCMRKVCATYDQSCFWKRFAWERQAQHEHVLDHACKRHAFKHTWEKHAHTIKLYTFTYSSKKKKDGQYAHKHARKKHARHKHTHKNVLKNHAQHVKTPCTVHAKQHSQVQEVRMSDRLYTNS